jgi:hypothetical protein
MKLRPYFSVLTALLPVISSSWACSSFTAARDQYFSGHEKEAVAALLCLKEKYPEDVDVRRLLSDIDWWNGRIGQSVDEAKQAEALHPWSFDPDVAIHLAERTRPFQLTLEGDGVWGEGRTGADLSGLLDYRFEDRDHIRAGFSRISRTFPDSNTLNDRIFRAGYARVQGERSYIESEVTYSPDHGFSPEYSIGIEPHYVLKDDSDVSLLFQFLHYTNSTSTQEVGLLAPSWRNTYGLWTFSGRVDFLISNDILPSARGSASYPILPKTSVEVFAAGGRALEGIDLPDTFYSLGGAIKRFLRPELAISLQGDIYRGDIYSENRLGLGADWFF